jgi:hypothetical protein
MVRHTVAAIPASMALASLVIAAMSAFDPDDGAGAPVLGTGEVAVALGAAWAVAASPAPLPQPAVAARATARMAGPTTRMTVSPPPRAGRTPAIPLRMAGGDRAPDDFRADAGPRSDHGATIQSGRSAADAYRAVDRPLHATRS